MNQELLTFFEYMERERGIDRDVLAGAVETALLSAAKKSVGPARDLRVEVNRKTGAIRALARVQVVEQVQNPHDQITPAQASRKLGLKVTPGEFVEIEVTPRDFGRIAAQTAKQAILQSIRQAERERAYQEYKDSPGDIVSGAVRRFERSDVVVDLGRAEGLMPARERVPTEEYQIGERIRALVVKVASDAQGPQILLSRAHPDFVRRLFELEVSEIADGTVEIKSMAREAGWRTKLAVSSRDEKVDPIGACVGMRGIRVKNIVRELSNEKIDIVRWRADTRAYVTEALAPAKLLQVEVDEDRHAVRVLVDPDQLSLAIGKKGQNARLAAKLTGWRIDIDRKEEEIPFEDKVARAIQALSELDGVGEELAAKMVPAGFLTIEGILAAELEDLQTVEGVDAAKAQEIHDAAAAAYEKEHGPLPS